MNHGNTNYESGYWTVVLDLSCSLCERFADFVKRFDRQAFFSMAASDDFKSTAVIEADSKSVKSGMFLSGRRGELLSGSAAIEMVIRHIPQMRPFRWMVERTYGRNGAEQAYLDMKRLKGCGNCGKKRLQ